MRIVVSLSLLLLLAISCGAVANSGTLRDAFFSEVSALPGITEFQVKKNDLIFVFMDEDYVCTVLAAQVEPFDDERYTHLGTIDCQFTENGVVMESFDHLRKARMDPENIVGAWDSKREKWRFDIEFDFEKEEEEE